jgi:hypothetical protein
MIFYLIFEGIPTVLLSSGKIMCVMSYKHNSIESYFFKRSMNTASIEMFVGNKMLHLLNKINPCSNPFSICPVHIYFAGQVI